MLMEQIWLLENGHLDILKWLEDKKEYYLMLMEQIWLHKNGHLDVLKWLAERRYIT